jgi:hypothetical protein
MPQLEDDHQSFNLTQGESAGLCLQECLHCSVPFIREQAKVVFVLETVKEGVALAQVSLIGKGLLASMKVRKLPFHQVWEPR